MNGIGFNMVTVDIHNRARSRPKPIHFKGDSYRLTGSLDRLRIKATYFQPDRNVLIDFAFHGEGPCLSLILYDNSLESITEKTLHTLTAIARDMVRRKKKKEKK